MSNREEEGLLEDPNARTDAVSGDLTGSGEEQSFIRAAAPDGVQTEYSGGSEMSMDLSGVRVGTDVFGSDGDKIGDVGEVGADYVLVRAGAFTSTDLYIPMSALAGSDQNGLRLSVPASQVQTMGWDQSPTMGMGSTTETTTSTGGVSVGSSDVSTEAAYTESAGATPGGYTDTTGATGGYTETTETTGTAGTSTGEYVDTTGAASASASDDDATRVRRYEEELQAQKVERQAGEVRVNKDVIEEEQTLEVPVTREQVQVRSVTPTEDVVDTSEAFQEGSISVPVREEDVELSKQTRVAEELEIQKQRVTETERVSDTVRKEVVDVEPGGDLDVEGGSQTGGSSRGSL
jgi:uncharacterized protein (TIGR02271 family)